MSRMTYMRSWKSLGKVTSHTWLGLTPQIGRPLSRIVGAIGFFLGITQASAYPSILVGLSILLHISSIANTKRITLSTAPCTTPFSVALSVEYVLQMATYSVRFVMN
jgi:hypothetical protein